MIPKSSKSKELYLFKTVDCSPSSISHPSSSEFDIEDGVQPSVPTAASSNRSVGLQVTSVGQMSRVDSSRLENGDSRLTIEVTEPTVISQYGDESYRRFRVQYADDDSDRWREIKPAWTLPQTYNLNDLSWDSVDAELSGESYEFDEPPCAIVDPNGYLYIFVMARVTVGGSYMWRMLCARRHQKDGYDLVAPGPAGFTPYAASHLTNHSDYGDYINNIQAGATPPASPTTRLTLAGCIHGEIPYVALVDGGGYASGVPTSAHLFYLNTKSDGVHPRIDLVKSDFTGYNSLEDKTTVDDVRFTHGATLISAAGKMLFFVGGEQEIQNNSDYGIFIFETRDTTNWTLEQGSPGPTGAKLGKDSVLVTLEDELDEFTAIDDYGGITLAVTDQGKIYVRDAPGADFVERPNPCSRNNHPLWSAKIIGPSSEISGSDSIMYVGGDWGLLMRSMDSGQTWKVISTGFATTAPDPGGRERTYTGTDDLTYTDDPFRLVTPIYGISRRQSLEWDDYSYDDFSFHSDVSENIRYVKQDYSHKTVYFGKKSIFTYSGRAFFVGTGFTRPPRVIQILSAPIGETTTQHGIWFICETAVFYMPDAADPTPPAQYTATSGAVNSTSKACRPVFLSKDYSHAHEGKGYLWYIRLSNSAASCQINDAVLRKKNAKPPTTSNFGAWTYKSEDEVELILCGRFEKEEDSRKNEIITDLPPFGIYPARKNFVNHSYKRKDGLHYNGTSVASTVRLTRATVAALAGANDHDAAPEHGGVHFGDTQQNHSPYNAVAIYSSFDNEAGQERIWVAGSEGQLDELNIDVKKTDDDLYPFEDTSGGYYFNDAPQHRDVLEKIYTVPIETDSPSRIRDLVVIRGVNNESAFYLTDSSGLYHFAYITDDAVNSNVRWHKNRFLTIGEAKGDGFWIPIHATFSHGVDDPDVAIEVLAGCYQYLYLLSPITFAIHPHAITLPDNSIMLVVADVDRQKIAAFYTKDGVNPDGYSSFVEVSFQRYKSDAEQDGESYLNLPITGDIIPSTLPGQEDLVNYPRIISGTDGMIYILGHDGIGPDGDKNYAAVSLTNTAPLDSWVMGNTGLLPVPAINLKIGPTGGGIGGRGGSLLEYRYGRHIYVDNSYGDGFAIRDSRTWKIKSSGTTRPSYEFPIKPIRYDLGVADVGIVWLSEPEKTDKFYITKDAQFGVSQLSKESPSFFWRTGTHANIAGSIVFEWDRTKMQETLGDGNVFNVNACALFGTNFPYAKWAITVPDYTGDGWPTDRQLWTEFSMTSIVEQGVTGRDLSKTDLPSSDPAGWASFFRDTTKSWTPNQWASGGQSYYLFVSTDGAALGPNVAWGSVAVRKIVGNSSTTLYYNGDPIEFTATNPFIEYAIFTDRFFNDGRHGTLQINSGQDEDYGNPVPSLVDTDFEFGKIIRLIIPKLMPTDGLYQQIGSVLFGKCIPANVKIEGDYQKRHKYSIGWRWLISQPTQRQSTPSGVVFVDHLGSAAATFTLNYDNIEQWEADVFYSMMGPDIFKAFALCFDGENINSTKLVRLQSEPQINHVGGSLFTHGVTLEEVR